MTKRRLTEAQKTRARNALANRRGIALSRVSDGDILVALDNGTLSYSDCGPAGTSPAYDGDGSSYDSGSSNCGGGGGGGE